MTSHESQLDFSVLQHEVEVMDYEIDGSGAEMAMKPCVDIPPLPHELTAAVREIEALTGMKARFVMLNRLPPGIAVPEHTDTVTYTPERWHLVIKTNPLAYFRSESTGKLHMKRGLWYGPIPYRTNHTVENLGPTDRVHFVVDLLRGIP